MDQKISKHARILIVDDQQANVDLLEGYLEMLGYENIRYTTDPREVIQLYKSFNPDLILLDLVMPYFSGFEVLKQLRQLIPETTYLPILVLSANIESQARQKALAEGATDFISKPFNLEEVGLRIYNMLYTRVLFMRLESHAYHLEELVKERTLELEKIGDDLRVAKNNAENSNRLKDMFLQTISHEVRTPLNGIIGSSILLTSDNLTPDKKHEYVELMDSSVKRLIATITDYIDISLIHSGNLKVDYQMINIRSFMLDIKTKYEKTCKLKKLLLEFIVPENYPENNYMTDVDLIKLIFSHLIENAIKFTTKGSIQVGFNMLPNQFEFFVRDTGIGIEKHLQKRIFNTFEQGDNSTTRSYEGSGLGLSICKGILTLLGGEIWMESHTGSGSTFFFTLPLTSQPESK